MKINAGGRGGGGEAAHNYISPLSELFVVTVKQRTKKEERKENYVSLDDFLSVVNIFMGSFAEEEF